MQSSAKTVEEYLDSLPEDRRRAIEAVRKVIKANLDKKFKEGVQYGMIGYYVPHNVYPAGYHCDPKQPLPFAALASQKNYMAVYLLSIYMLPEHTRAFEAEWKKSGKKLDMGKSCIRFKKLEDLPLDVIGAAVKRMDADTFIATYEAARDAAKTGPSRKPTKAAAEAKAKPGKAADAKAKPAKTSDAKAKPPKTADAKAKPARAADTKANTAKAARGQAKTAEPKRVKAVKTDATTAAAAPRQAKAAASAPAKRASAASAPAKRVKTTGAKKSGSSAGGARTKQRSPRD